MTSRLMKLANRCFSRTSEYRQLEPLPPSGPRVVEAGECGLIDDVRRGWFNRTSGELARGFSITADDTVVDVGCGFGDVCAFAASFGAEVIGTDIDPDRIENVKRKMERFAQTPFQGYVSDSNPLPLADQTATKVISMEVMEHVDDPAQFLSELVRVGKPGAMYLITVPDPVAETVQTKFAPSIYWEKPNHIRILQRDEFDRLIEQAGLELIEHTHTGFFWSMWWIFFWASQQEKMTPQGPVLENWTRTWFELLQIPNAETAINALDAFMPKSQVVIARKPV
ncbi:class I SAM-dependent methyltransferase [Schlesneria sp. T3-172]|uniref:class I SAM-dependent methyltransferase n=1 Tax=Schlesneria sphaerica TaxID=3373610 RepID=UPI0037CC4407